MQEGRKEGKKRLKKLLRSHKERRNVKLQKDQM